MFPQNSGRGGTQRTADLTAHNPKVAGSNPAPATIENLANSGPPGLLFGGFFMFCGVVGGRCWGRG